MEELRNLCCQILQVPKANVKLHSPFQVEKQVEIGLGQHSYLKGRDDGDLQLSSRKIFVSPAYLSACAS